MSNKVTLTDSEFHRLVWLADNYADGTSDSAPYEKDAARALEVLYGAKRRADREAGNDLAHVIAEALEETAPYGVVVGEDERAVIRNTIKDRA